MYYSSTRYSDLVFRNYIYTRLRIRVRARAHSQSQARIHTGSRLPFYPDPDLQFPWQTRKRAPSVRINPDDRIQIWLGLGRRQVQVRPIRAVRVILPIPRPPQE